MSSEESKFYHALEGAIDKTTASYDEDWSINNLDSALLPSRRRVIEALHELQPVLYMGFYATRHLGRTNLRHGIAEHLHHGGDLLVEQVERALRYQDWHGICKDCPKPGNGRALTIELFQRLPELRRLLNLDVMAAFEGDPAAQSVEEVVFSYPSIAAITTYRLAHELWKLRIPLLPRILTEHAHGKTGIDIHPGAKIGERFFIDHGTGVVIGATAEIGNNVKVYQGVTLGALSVPDRESPEAGAKRHPTIEDDVTLYSGATILGGETVIGRGSVVGGNVWLVQSIAPGSKVFGRARNGSGNGGKDNAPAK